LCTLFKRRSPARILRSAIVPKPSTLLHLHNVLVKRKYRMLFSPQRRRPGPKGPNKELIDAVGVSFRVAKGVRFRTGAFRARSVVIGTSLVEADRGTLTITSLRTVFSGQRKTLDLPHSKLVNLNVYTDGISFNMSNRQTVPLFRVQNGQVVAAIINAAAQRVG
jgi:hypothetical protein